MSDTPAPDPAAAAAPPQIDTAQVKTTLGLPDTATDPEVIAALVQLVSGLQQKYQQLLDDTVALEDKVANRDVEDFKDVITPNTTDFWRHLLLVNRDQSLAVLASMRAQKAAPPAAPQPVPAVPLRNRLEDKPRSIDELAGGASLADANRAVKIRNRAHELRQTEKVPWSQAFSRAEKEMTT